MLFFFPPALHWLFLDPLHFHRNFRVSWSISVKKKKGSWNFDSGCIESVDQFGDLCHLSSIQPFDP